MSVAARSNPYNYQPVTDAARAAVELWAEVSLAPKPGAAGLPGRLEELALLRQCSHAWGVERGQRPFEHVGRDSSLGAARPSGGAALSLSREERWDVGPATGKQWLPGYHRITETSQ